jgi:hypothetical protein
MSPYRAAICTVVLLGASFSAIGQSTVGELLEKGGKKLLKDDYTALAPFRVVYQWPNRQGEGDLVYLADGTLSGSEYHNSSRSTSPATGTWVADENGKWCMKKFMQLWNSRTDQCWYGWKLGDDYYSGLSEDKDAKVMKVKSVVKQ